MTIRSRNINTDIYQKVLNGTQPDLYRLIIHEALLNHGFGNGFNNNFILCSFCELLNEVPTENYVFCIKLDIESAKVFCQSFNAILASNANMDPFYKMPVVLSHASIANKYIITSQALEEINDNFHTESVKFIKAYIGAYIISDEIMEYIP